MAVYQIYDVDGLQDMKNHLADDCVLMNDIDASATRTWNDGAGFEPIGTSSNQFTGSFDGQGYKITGLYINRPNSDGGLFGYAIAPTKDFKNLVIENAEIYVDSGGIAGCYLCFNNIQKISVQGKLFARHGGGLSYALTCKSSISECCADVEIMITGVTTPISYGGAGFCCYLGNGCEGTLSNCYAKGRVSRGAGFFYEFRYQIQQPFEIKNCYCDVEAYCGFFASSQNMPTITRCYYNSDKCVTSAAGTPLTDAQMRQLSTFNQDIYGKTGVVNVTYPILRQGIGNITYDNELGWILTITSGDNFSYDDDWYDLKIVYGSNEYHPGHYNYDGNTTVLTDWSQGEMTGVSWYIRDNFMGMHTIWVSGDNFSGLTWGDHIWIDGTEYEVSEVYSNTDIVTTCQTEKTGVPYQAQLGAAWSIADWGNLTDEVWGMMDGYRMPRLAWENRRTLALTFLNGEDPQAVNKAVILTSEEDQLPDVSVADSFEIDEEDSLDLTLVGEKETQAENMLIFKATDDAISGYLTTGSETQAEIQFGQGTGGGGGAVTHGYPG